MMASHLLRTIQVVKKVPSLNVCAVRLGHIYSPQEFDLDKIGKREVVGPGISGQISYKDDIDCPFPAIRFRPNDAPGIQALKEKEKGDWHKLTKEEKKALYRASFCQTLSEVRAPNPIWKAGLAATLVSFGISLWIIVWLKKYVFDPLPESFSLENRQAELMKVLDLEAEPMEGISSKFDYEKGTWK